MSYAEQSDLLRWIDEDELLQLTDDPDAGIIDEQLVTDALEEASSLIDGFIGSRYTLPLATTPPLLTRFCVDLAICSLFDRRLGRPEQWKDRCANALRFLDKVATGKIKLGADDPSGTGASDTVKVAGPTALFPHSELDKY